MLNSVNLQGRLTRDPELRELATGKKIANFALAVDRGKEATDFIRCVAFDRVADTAASYLKKGDMAIVAGRLSVRTWKDKEEKTREETTVTVYGSKQYEPDDGEEPFRTIYALEVNDTYLVDFEDAERLHVRGAWPMVALFGGFSLLWAALVFFSIRVGRNPERYSKKVIRLFFKDGYVH